MAGPLRGGGVKSRAIKKKIMFFQPFLPYVPTFQRPLSSRGRGGLGLMAWPLREELIFCDFP